MKKTIFANDFKLGLEIFRKADGKKFTIVANVYAMIWKLDNGENLYEIDGEDYYILVEK